MENNQLIKHDGGLIKRVGNAISVTNKLLALTEPQLIPYRKKDKWGFCTPDKKIVIDCVWDGVQKFHKGFAKVKLNKRWWNIDKSGLTGDAYKIEIPENYSSLPEDILLLVNTGFSTFENVESFIFAHIYKYEPNGVSKTQFSNIAKTIFDEIPQSEILKTYETREGLKLVKSKLNNKYGFENEIGSITIPCIYESAFTFSEGLAVVNLNGKEGYIDKKGQIVIPIIFSGCFSFSDGLALVLLGNGKKGYINKNGIEYWED